MAVFTLVSGGCAVHRGRPAAPAVVPGYANLDALVRRHPGWVGVSRYDEALSRLSAAAGRTPGGIPSDASLVSLPPAAADAPSAPALRLPDEKQRLGLVERTQVARLEERQAQSRQRQIALDRQGWERQAAAQYAVRVGAAQSDYTRRLAELAVGGDGRRLNLTLQIRALQKIISGWRKSVPPTPVLNQARAELTQRQAQLLSLDQARGLAEAQARRNRAAALAAASQARDAELARLTTSEDARLRAQDAAQVTSLRGRLAQQLQALFLQEQSLSVPPVPPVGGLGTQDLPAQPVMVVVSSGAAHSLRMTRSLLQAQRARWLAFLYSDTRAAAQDAAQQQHWVVTFGPPVPGERDLTAPLAQALTTRLWKS